MGVIDGEYLENDDNEKSLSDIIIDGIEKKGYEKFPVSKRKDIDGDTFDSNEQLRNAYIEGSMEMLLFLLKN